MFRKPSRDAVAQDEGRFWRLIFVVFWFLLNISIGIVTKSLFLHEQVCLTEYGCQHFRFPLATTCIHLVTTQVFTYIHVFVIRGSVNGPELDWPTRVRKVGPLALCFAIAVGLGNVSLNYLYPSYKSMVGGGTPFITVLMSVLFTDKRYNWWTWASMPLIFGGIVICSQKEANFSVLGLLFAVTAMVARAAKSIVQASLLCKKDRIDPVTLLYYMSPFALVLLTGLTLATEGPLPFQLLWQGGLEWWAQGLPASGGEPAGSEGGGAGWPRLVVVLFLSGVNACLLNVTGFYVTRYTSAVTLQVLGVVKSCFGIVASVAILGNTLHNSQLVGTTVCFLGVWLYERKGGISSSSTPVAPLKPTGKGR